MKLRQITPPASKPVSVEEMAEHLRADLSAERALVGAYIGAATARAETVTRRALITQTWELVLDAFPANNGPIILPLPPLQSVTSIKYIDTDNVLQTLSAATYSVDNASEPGQITPAYQCSWPAALDISGSVVIRFMCGYDAVPDGILVWIMMNAANLYENRESLVVGLRAQSVELKTLADGLLDPYRVVTW